MINLEYSSYKKKITPSWDVRKIQRTPGPGVFSMQESRGIYKAKFCVSLWKHDIPYGRCCTEQTPLCPMPGPSVAWNTIPCYHTDLPGSWTNRLIAPSFSSSDGCHGNLTKPVGDLSMTNGLTVPVTRVEQLCPWRSTGPTWPIGSCDTQPLPDITQQRQSMCRGKIRLQHVSLAGEVTPFHFWETAVGNNCAI